MKTMNNLSSITKKVGKGLTALALVGSLAGCGDYKVDKEKYQGYDVTVENWKDKRQILIMDKGKDNQFRLETDPYILAGQDKHKWIEYRTPLYTIDREEYPRDWKIIPFNLDPNSNLAGYVNSASIQQVYDKVMEATH